MHGLYFVAMSLALIAWSLSTLAIRRMEIDASNRRYSDRMRERRTDREAEDLRVAQLREIAVSVLGPLLPHLFPGFRVPEDSDGDDGDGDDGDDDDDDDTAELEL